jgi:hypothetical protein
MKAEGPGLALVHNSTICPDQVKPVRPACVRSLNLIVKAIDHCGKFDAEFSHASAGDRSAFGLVLGTGEEHLIADITLHLPHIRWVGLKNVNRVKVRLAFVLLRQFVQGGNLPPEGRSSIAAEDQHHWSFGP